jgi:hypothetical protein
MHKIHELIPEVNFGKFKMTNIYQLTLITFSFVNILFGKTEQSISFGPIIELKIGIKSYIQYF